MRCKCTEDVDGDGFNSWGVAGGCAGVHVCVCACVCGYACVYVLLLLRDRISFKLMFVTVPFIKTWLLLKPDHRIL